MINLHKKGIRALGIAESFDRTLNKSILVGVVIRADLELDGIGFSMVTLGGMDSTQAVLNILDQLNRKDLHLMLLGGAIISYYNILDLERIYSRFNSPLICISYREQKSQIQSIIREKFQDWELRLELYRRLGERIPIKLHTGHWVWTRAYGVEPKLIKPLLDKFTIHGKYPEPIRVAKLIAHSLLRSGVI